MTDEFRTHGADSAIDDEPVAHPPLRTRMLTLWEPWASLCMAGAKPFEFRGRMPPSTIVGQRIVMHAAKRPVDKDECRHMLRMLEGSLPNSGVAELCLIPERAIPVLENAIGDRLTLGAGLGTVQIGRGRNGVIIARDYFGAESVDVGDLLDANFGWPIFNIRRWDHPIYARGGQGIKFWPHEVPDGRPVTYPEGSGIPLHGVQ